MKAIFLSVCLTMLLISCNNHNSNEIFPYGERAPEKNFTGKVWLYPMVANDSTFHLVMGSVTFEKGARSNWHSHPAGQILLISEGTCHSQERGKPIKVYHKGDVLKCMPNIEHWHGASPDNSMTHISVNPNTENGIVKWLEPVTEEQYTSDRH